MRRFVFNLLVTGAVLVSIPSRGADVSLFGVIKAEQFVQTNDGSPFSPATNGYLFNCFVFASTNGSVTNATLTPPVGSPVALLPQPSLSGFLFQQYFNTSAALDAAYPVGTIFSPASYNVAMHGVNDGLHSANLSFASSKYPMMPEILDFSAAQSIDTTTPFTFTWVLADGQGSDLVQLTVQDAASNTVFSTPFPATPGALTGFSNSTTIPPNALPPGANLFGFLSVGHGVGINTNAYPGATGVAILGINLQFGITTRPAPLVPRVTVTSGRAFPVHLQFSAETNRNYHLQSSSNLVAWNDLLLTNLTSGTNVSFTDSSSTNTSRRYYRVQVGP